MRLLIAYDGSTGADAAIEDMRRAGLPEEVDALVLCVAEGGLEPQNMGLADTDFKASWRQKLADAEALATTAGQRLQSYFPRWTVSPEALWGTPAKVILETSGWWRPDLLVAGSHGHSRVARLFLGSVSVELIHKAASSVRVARPGKSAGISPIRIIIGNDGSAEAEAAIRAVTRRSWPEKTEAHVVSVVNTLVPAVSALEASTYAHEPAFTVILNADDRERVRLRNVAEHSADCLRRAGLIATTTVIDGDPGQVILAEVKRCNADAVFVGARGVGGVERFLLGSVSTYLLTHAHCTVEVVR